MDGISTGWENVTRGSWFHWSAQADGESASAPANMHSIANKVTDFIDISPL
jgi:hypothetical protein